jgi:hypothetical protein
MRENSARTSTRWGGQEERRIDAGQTITVNQFVDVAILAEQELALALFGVATGPVAGLSVEWTIRLGNGSFTYDEVFTVAVQDKNAQTALVLHRPAKRVQVSARIISAAAPTNTVKIAALIAPVSPTWLTDLACETPASEVA